MGNIQGSYDLKFKAKLGIFKFFKGSLESKLSKCILEAEFLPEGWIDAVKTSDGFGF